jgi:hypothetical protein
MAAFHLRRYEGQQEFRASLTNGFICRGASAVFDKPLLTSPKSRDVSCLKNPIYLIQPIPSTLYLAFSF